METSLKYELKIKDKEAKIGDKLWFKEYGGKYTKAYIRTISIFQTKNFGEVIEIIVSCEDSLKYINIESLSYINNHLFWEKPKRDFSPYFNFDEAPKGFDFGVISEGGYAYWFKDEPIILGDTWWCNYSNPRVAGFRQNLINPATGIVDDWQDSLVERPKETK